MDKYKLVIVESPNKVALIQSYLGSGYKVVASVGHVRDLPTSASDIPAQYKGQKWARLGVNVDDNFAPLYVTKAAAKTVSNIKDCLKNASEVLLATDEDREGEAISWHITQLFKIKVPIKRMRYNEVTKKAVLEALNNLTDIDINLVQAQEARRVVDRLYGYMVSPVLWQKMVPNLSAGRVQSVVLRLLVERERERMRFISGDYFDITGQYRTAKGELLDTVLATVDGRSIAGSGDISPEDGRLKAGSKALLLDESGCRNLLEELQKQTAKVVKVESKPKSNSPYAPFTTSTLQQEGARKLRWKPSQTMRVAQTLFENGLITYMRTDSTFLSQDGINAARLLIKEHFGEQFLPEKARFYTNKTKNAQEAHEAIRPAIDNNGTFFAPASVARLGNDALRLYELIYKRTLACQMKDALVEITSVTVEQGRATFKTSGKTIRFAGYMRAYVEGSDSPEAKLADQEKILPAVSNGDQLQTKELSPQKHSTKPPARYTNAELVKTMEATGIGRPSTWGPMVDLVVERYAFMNERAIVPTFLGMAIVNLLEKYFTNLVDYTFTAKMEEDLDSISNGQLAELEYLKQFYYGADYPGLLELVNTSGEKIDPRVVCGIPLGTDNDGHAVEVRVGRFGLFLTNGESRCSLQPNTMPDELTLAKAVELLDKAEVADMPIGTHPESGLPIYVKTGRFGPYVQLGDKDSGDKEKLKTAPLLKGMTVETVDLETALGLLSLPRTLGCDASGADVVAANGRFGPFVKCGEETRSLPAGTSPVTITLEEALALLSQPKTRGRGRAVKAVSSEKPDNSGRLLGKHPVSGLELRIKDGRFGPYITDGTVNATVPKARAAEAFADSFTLDDALAVYDAKMAKIAADGGVVKKRTFKRTAAKSVAKSTDKVTSKTTRKSTAKKA